MRQYFLTIPRDFEEAAKLDGAGYFKTFWRVMLPLAAPAIAALAILQFQGTWNDFFWPLIIFGQGNPTTTRFSSGSRRSASSTARCGRELMAGSVIAIAPILVHLPDLPAVLHRGRHGCGGQGMSAAGRHVARVPRLLRQLVAPRADQCRSRRRARGRLRRDARRTRCDDRASWRPGRSRRRSCTAR